MTSRFRWSVLSGCFAVCLMGAASAADDLSKLGEAPGMHKVAYVLKKMAKEATAARKDGLSDLSPMGTTMVPMLDTGAMLVVIHTSGPLTEAQEGALLDLGMEIESTLSLPSDLASSLPEVGRIEAWVPPDQLDELAAMDWVFAVTPLDKGSVDRIGTGPIVSEGVFVLQAQGAQFRNFTGRGVTVGVVSDGVASLGEAQARGELPFVNVIDPGIVEPLFAGDGDEGTAMLEIVSDMAPGADLAFAGGLDGVNGHVDDLIALANVVDVITEDLAFDFEPKFQQGIIAAVADAIAEAGIGVFSSAGNRGQGHVENVLAIGTGQGPDGNVGPFTGCTVPPDNTVAFLGGTDTTIDAVLTGRSGRIVLQWSEPRAIFPTAGQGGFTDLDLYILDSTGTRCLAESINAQGFGMGDSIEVIAGNAAPEFAGLPVKIVVDVFDSTSAAAPPVIDLSARGLVSLLEGSSRRGSLNPDVNYFGAASSVAALDARSRQIQDFSSGGPVLTGLTTVFDAPGLPGLPGPGVGETFGPTFTAVDGVAVSGVGGFGAGTCPAERRGGCRFFGTSAAAPHAAGCAALAREAQNLQDAADVQALLSATAVDLAPAGPDLVSGAGLLDCRAAVLN